VANCCSLYVFEHFVAKPCLVITVSLDRGQNKVMLQISLALPAKRLKFLYNIRWALRNLDVDMWIFC
jgi:hypothetical protein